MDEELFVNDLHRVVFEEMREMRQSTARETFTSPTRAIIAFAK